MPSGAKKRKSAKRKQQMADAAAGPPATPHRPQENGHNGDLLHREDAAKNGGDGGFPSASSSSSPASSPREDHRSRSDEELLGSESVAIDSTTESDKGETLAQDDDDSAVVLEEVAFATAGEPFAKSEESVPVFEKSAEEVHVENIVSLPEEGKQVCVAAAEVIEETSGEVQVQVVPLCEELATAEQLGENRQDRCVAGKSETSVSAEVLSPNAPLVVHRSSWWSCCGLLDLVTDSGR